MAKEYSDAPEVREIAEKLIEILKPELEGFEIKFVMCSENPKKDGEEKAGLARKVTGLNAFIAGHPEGFFCLETGRPAWDIMDAQAQVRYVHHELCHFGVADSGNLMIIPHDIEEFNEIAEVHGAADDRLILFGAALEKGNNNRTNRDELIDRVLNG
jgi:hypothetical protein